MKLAILKVEAHNLLRYYNAESFNFTEGGGGGMYLPILPYCGLP